MGVENIFEESGVGSGENLEKSNKILRSLSQGEKIRGVKKNYLRSRESEETKFEESGE